MGKSKRLHFSFASKIMDNLSKVQKAGGKVDPQHRYYAYFAEASYQKASKRQKYMEDKVSDFSFVRVPHLSSNELDVYYNPNNRYGVISYRGTKNLKDLGTDALVATGITGLGKRYKTDKVRTHVALDWLSKNGIDNVDMVGHSLGGTLAAEMGKMYQEKMGEGQVYAFNPGSGLAEALRGPNETISGPDVNHINRFSVIGDPLSMLSAGATDTYYAQQSGVSNPHTVANFTGTGINEDAPVATPVHHQVKVEDAQPVEPPPKKRKREKKGFRALVKIT